MANWKMGCSLAFATVIGVACSKDHAAPICTTVSLDGGVELEFDDAGDARTDAGHPRTHVVCSTASESTPVPGNGAGATSAGGVPVFGAGGDTGGFGATGGALVAAGGLNAGGVAGGATLPPGGPLNGGTPGIGAAPGAAGTPGIGTPPGIGATPAF